MGRKGSWPPSFGYGRKRRFSGALFISSDWQESSLRDNPRPVRARNCARWYEDCLVCVPEDNVGDGCAPIDAGNVGTPPFSRNEAMGNRRQARNEHGGTHIETFEPHVHSSVMRFLIYLPSFATLMCHELRIMLKVERTAVSKNSCI